MNPLPLHDFHHGLHARFVELNGVEAVADYGDALAEHTALREAAGVIDLSFRSRLCLLGADRMRFLHGQVTNDVNGLAVGQGCYAALVTAKGKLQSDLFIHRLADELLLDFEPGLAGTVSARLDQYVIADDVQVVDVSPHYGLLSVQGPKAADVVKDSGPGVQLPSRRLGSVRLSDATLGEVYVMNNARLSTAGFDLFVPADALVTVADKLIAAARSVGGRVCGWKAFDIARIEAGIPRYGVDMDETHLAPEAIDHAISYSKGCYIGQEVIARIRTYGQVTKSLCGLRLADELPALPQAGEKLFKDGKEAGYVTSAAKSPALGANIALGYVRREYNSIGADFALRTSGGESFVKVVELPFRAS